MWAIAGVNEVVSGSRLIGMQHSNEEYIVLLYGVLRQKVYITKVLFLAAA